MYIYVVQKHNSYGFKLLYNIMDMNQKKYNIVLNAEKMRWVCYVIDILLKIVVREQSILIEQSINYIFSLSIIGQ